MSKSDKELAVEIVVAFINANPTQPTFGGNVQSKVERYINLEGVCNSIKAVYDTLQNLDSPNSQDKE